MSFRPRYVSLSTIFCFTNDYLQIDYHVNNGSQGAATTGAATIIKITTSPE
jgi:hypothetical protein